MSCRNTVHVLEHANTQSTGKLLRKFCAMLQGMIIEELLDCKHLGVPDTWDNVNPSNGLFFRSQSFVSYQSNVSFNPCTWENRENRECGPDDSWHQMYTLPRMRQCILTMVSWLLGSYSRQNNVIGFTSMILKVETDARREDNKNQSNLCTFLSFKKRSRGEAMWESYFKNQDSWQEKTHTHTQTKTDV